MPRQKRPQLTGTGYAAKRVTKPPEWHGLVVWDVLFNGLATGLFLVATLCELMSQAVFGPVVRLAYPIAFLLLAIDLTLLVLDLGDPLRFHHMLRVVKPSSPMSFGVWSLTVFSLPAAVAAALSLFGDGSTTLEGVRRIAAILGLVPALASAVYKGVLFSTSAQPGWKDARWLGGYLTSSALTLGCAEMLGLSVLLGQEPAAAVLRPALGLLLLLGLFPLGLVIAEIVRSTPQLLTHARLRTAVGFAVVGGVVIPLALVLIGGGTGVLLAAALFVLLGGLASRYAIVQIPHAVH